MTTVVYHKASHSLFADSRSTDGSGYVMHDKEEKICIRDDGLVFCLAGAIPTIQEIENSFPNINTEHLSGSSQGFVYDPDTDIIVVIAVAEDPNTGTYDLCQWEVEHDMCFGSGRDFAMAGLDLGLTPAEAIEYAATRDTCSNQRVTMLDLLLHKQEYDNAKN